MSKVEKAETCFQKAIEIAQKQEAKSWELRAATSLARLWQQQGKNAEARNLLAPVYNWTRGYGRSASGRLRSRGETPPSP